MIIIIAGGREVTKEDVWEGMNRFLEICPEDVEEVVSGKCPKGADRYGEEWAESYNLDIKSFPADWNGPLGKGAGMARNTEMADYLVAQREAGKLVSLVAFWNGKSRGTRDMISKAGKCDINVTIFRTDWKHNLTQIGLRYGQEQKQN